MCKHRQRKTTKRIKMNKFKHNKKQQTMSKKIVMTFYTRILLSKNNSK